MSPEQNTPRPASRLAGTANLVRIRLLTAELGTRISSRKEAGDVQVDVAWTVSPPAHGTHESLHWLSAVIEFRVAIRSAKGNGESPVVWVHPTFEAHYHFPVASEPSLPELKEFAETNVVFNLWPYVREFVQNSTARMDLPALTIPLRRFSGTIGTGKKPTTAKTGPDTERAIGKPRSTKTSGLRPKTRA